MVKLGLYCDVLIFGFFIIGIKFERNLIMVIIILIIEEDFVFFVVCFVFEFVWVDVGMEVNF